MVCGMWASQHAPAAPSPAGQGPPLRNDALVPWRTDQAPAEVSPEQQAAEALPLEAAATAGQAREQPQAPEAANEEQLRAMMDRIADRTATAAARDGGQGEHNDGGRYHLLRCTHAHKTHPPLHLPAPSTPSFIDATAAQKRAARVRYGGASPTYLSAYSLPGQSLAHITRHKLGSFDSECNATVRAL
jgi:hypothetical protein